MSAGLALLRRAAVADLRLDRDERRTLLVRLCFLNGHTDSREVVAVLDSQCLEAESLHAFLNILSERKVGTALDGNRIAVIKHDQLREPQRTRQRKRFGGNTLHHAAVAAQCKSVMIDDRISRLVEHRRKMRLGHRHADSHSHACAQRSRRRLDADRVAVLGMPRRQGTVLPEIFQVVHRQAVTEKMEQRI